MLAFLQFSFLLDLLRRAFVGSQGVPICWPRDGQRAIQLVDHVEHVALASDDVGSELVCSRESLLCVVLFFCELVGWLELERVWKRVAPIGDIDHTTPSSPMVIPQRSKQNQPNSLHPSLSSTPSTTLSMQQ